VTAGNGAGSLAREGGPRISLVLVAAVADNGVIGQGGTLPWRLKSDMKHFRDVTMGKPIVMGRKTYLSIGKPLPGRTNIVVSRDRAFAAPGVLAAPGVEAALAAARGDALRRASREIAVIGGADLYAQTIGRADRLVITQVHLAPTGDTIFPAIDPAQWRERERIDHSAQPGDEAAFTIVVYERLAERAALSQ
jgi:dihydrofolate reductase